VKPDEIEACRRFVEPFGLPYYPGFEPYVEHFGGTEVVRGGLPNPGRPITFTPPTHGA
jgi:hypothetical protein